MENIQLTLYKALLSFEKVSTLDLMRSYYEFLYVPGYKITEYLHTGVKEGYVKQIEEADKMYYSPTEKCREFFVRMEQEKREAEENKAKELKSKKRKTKIKFASIITCVCLVVAFVTILNIVIIPNYKVTSFIKKYGQETYDRYGYFNVGDVIRFGAYEQDNNKSNGAEKLEWIVLEIDDAKALVLNKSVLDRVRYHTEHESITWEKCSLRKWLNDDFINSAFSKEEKTKIQIVNDTHDKVFALSFLEAKKYLEVFEKYSCEPTSFAMYRGVSYDYCEWWLRTPGESNLEAMYFSEDLGEIVEDGVRVDDFHWSSWGGRNYCGVRPALWINLNS